MDHSFIRWTFTFIWLIHLHFGILNLLTFYGTRDHNGKRCKSDSYHKFEIMPGPLKGFPLSQNRALENFFFGQECCCEVSDALQPLEFFKGMGRIVIMEISNEHFQGNVLLLEKFVPSWVHLSWAYAEGTARHIADSMMFPLVSPQEPYGKLVKAMEALIRFEYDDDFAEASNRIWRQVKLDMKEFLYSEIFEDDSNFVEVRPKCRCRYSGKPLALNQANGSAHVIDGGNANACESCFYYTNNGPCPFCGEETFA